MSVRHPADRRPQQRPESQIDEFDSPDRQQTNTLTFDLENSHFGVWGPRRLLQCFYHWDDPIFYFFEIFQKKIIKSTFFFFLILEPALAAGGGLSGDSGTASLVGRTGPRARDRSTLCLLTPHHTPKPPCSLPLSCYTTLLD